MRLTLTSVLAITAAGLAASPLAAQENREQLIAAARAESDFGVALDIYLAAAEPVGIDSLWAVSVYEISQILRDVDDVAASDTWLRWAARHGAAWPIDPDWFAPSLVTAFAQAAAAVAAETGGIEDTLGEDAAVTSWEWPADFQVGTPGTLVVESMDPGVALTVSVGAATADADAPVTLATGTYEILVTAAGHDEARVRREVLPGVSTRVAVELAPVLTDLTAESVGSRVLQLRYLANGQLQCSNAVPLANGLALGSLSAIASAARLDVVSPNRLFEDVEIIESDASTDLAVLRLDGDPSPQDIATSVLLPSYAWSVFRTGCDGPLGSQRVRRPQAGVAAVPGLPGGAIGSPVVDAEGRVVAMVVGDGRLASVESAEALVQTAIGRSRDGGFPFVWVTVGVAAAAGAAVYFLKGKSPTPQPNTGGIIIVIPSS